MSHCSHPRCQPQPTLAETRSRQRPEAYFGAMGGDFIYPVLGRRPQPDGGGRLRDEVNPLPCDEVSTVHPTNPGGADTRHFAITGNGVGLGSVWRLCSRQTDRQTRVSAASPASLLEILVRVCRCLEQERPSSRGRTWRPPGDWVRAGRLVAPCDGSPGTPDPHLPPRGFLSWDNAGLG